jgi:hypothetical protein
VGYDSQSSGRDVKGSVVEKTKKRTSAGRVRRTTAETPNRGILS